MADITIDSVNIELASDASKATSSIDKLISSINKIKAATDGAISGLTNLDNSIKNIVKNFSALSNVSSSFGQQISLIQQTTNEMRNLKKETEAPADLNLESSDAEQELSLLSQIKAQYNNIIESLNLMQGRLGGNKKAIGGILGTASNLNYVFNGLSKISRNIQKDLKPVTNILKKSYNAAKKLASTLNNSMGLDRTLKKLSKYLLALFSIRGAYAAINTLATSWLSSASQAAQQLNVNIDYLKFALGSAVSPVIEYIANMIYSIAKVIQTLVYSLTGINIFAKAFASNMKKASGSAAAVKKELSLAPFDELNALSKSSSGGGGSGGADLSPTWDLTEVDTTYNKWVERLKNFFEPLIDSWRTYGGAVTDKFKMAFSDTISAIGSVWKSFENIITNGTIYTTLGEILDIIDNIAVAFKNAWEDNGNGTKIIQNIANAFNNLLEAVNNLTKSKKFQDWLKNVISKLKDISEKIKSINWQPFVDYLADIGGKIGNAALFVLNKFVDLLKWIVEHPTVITIIGGIATAFISLKTIASIGTTISKISEGLKVFGKMSGSSKITSALTETGEIGTAAAETTKKLSLPDWKTLGKALAELAVVTTAVIAYVGVLGLFMKIPGLEETIEDGIRLLKKTFLGIGSIAIPLGILVAGVAVLGSIGVKTILTGCADLGLVIGGVTLIITALGLFMKIPNIKVIIDDGLEVLKKAFNGIGSIAIPLIGMSVAIVALGIVGIGTIVQGCAGFVLVIAAVGLVVAALGALAKSEKFMEVVNLGSEVFVKIAKTIGEFAGALVGGALAGISDGLPKIGENLSSFMINAGYFFDNINKINKDATEGVKNLAETFLILTAVNVIEGLTGWFAGKVNLVEFGKQLADFGPYLADYSNAVKSVNAQAVVASSIAAKSMLELYTLVPRQGGLAQLLLGSKSLAIVGVDLVLFGKLFKKYADSVDGVNSKAVSASADTAKAMLKLYDLVPAQFGLAQMFTGSKSFAIFGADLVIFGALFKKYADNIKGIDSGAVTASANTAKSMLELYALVPKSGGFAQLFTGSSKLSDFGKDLEKFGNYFQRYYSTISGISVGLINSVTNSIINLVNALIVIKQGGLNSTLADFGGALTKASKGMNDFFKNEFGKSKAESIGSEFGNALGSKIKTAIKNKLGTTIKLSSASGGNLTSFTIKAYAEGGMPDIGDVFLAGEAGPEWIGSLGNQTAVANQDQMTNVLRTASYEGVSRALRENPQSNKTDVYIGNEKVYDGYTKYANSQSNKYGTNIIRV